MGERRRAGAAHRRDGEARHRDRPDGRASPDARAAASSGRPSRRRRAIAPRRSGTGSAPLPKPSARTSSRCEPSAPPSRPNTSRARSRSASAPKRSRESTDWIATADALKALQAEWKTVGPAPRRDEQAVWERFRAACNAFFTRRQDDLKRRKDEWTVNLEKKEALIVRPKRSSSPRSGEARPPSSRACRPSGRRSVLSASRSPKQVWQRFRTAADKVFDRYRNRDAQALAERVSRRETICTEVEALAARGGALAEEIGPAREGAEPAHGLAAGRCAPARFGRARSTDRFDQALGTIVAASPATFRHTELDSTPTGASSSCCANGSRSSRSREPVGAGAASPVATLATQLREALAANTIGGRVDEESRWKNSEYEVRGAQDAWRQVGFVPEADRGAADRAVPARVSAVLRPAPADVRAAVGRSRAGRPRT